MFAIKLEVSDPKRIVYLHIPVKRKNREELQRHEVNLFVDSPHNALLIETMDAAKTEKEYLNTIIINNKQSEFIDIQIVDHPLVVSIRDVLSMI